LLLPQLHQLRKRQIILIIEFHIFVDTEVAQPFAFGIRPCLLAGFARLFQHGGFSATELVFVVIKTTMEWLASLQVSLLSPLEGSDPAT
jgi:hypothetical protein